MGILEYAWKAYASDEEEKYANIDDAVRVHSILDKVKESSEKERQSFFNRFLTYEKS